MSSEANPSGHGPEPALLRGVGTPSSDGGAWQAVERRVLLSKLERLEARARRLDDLESRLRDLSHEVQLLNRLSEATRAIHAAGDTRELIDTVLGQCLELTGAESASLFLRDARADELVLARARGTCPASAEGTRLPVGQGVAGFVAQHRQALHVVDIERDGRFAVRNSGRYATGSFVCVPVTAGEDLVAVLSVADRRDREPFSGDDLGTVERLARDLAAALRRLQSTEATKDLQQQFVSKLAHELRNPLDGVLRFINLTLADQHPEERRRRYLLASKQGIERLTGIVNSLTGFFRHAPSADELAGVNECLREAVALQEGKAEKLGVRVELDLEEGLPPVRCGSGLFQVFTNLVSNAFDAMAAGGGTLRVTSRLEGEAVAVRVQDTGCGMPPEVIERIFTPFFTTKAPGQGMGLGLAVCREIIGRLNGRIDVTSEPGKGTTFAVVVPLAKTQGAPRL